MFENSIKATDFLDRTEVTLPYYFSGSEIPLTLTFRLFEGQVYASDNGRAYSELKKKGYNALLDYNDKEYSSYHAKRPMIVFDVDSVRLQSIADVNPKVVNKLYLRYNAERILKDIPASSVGLVAKAGSMKLSECQSYIDEKLKDYLSG